MQDLSPRNIDGVLIRWEVPRLCREGSNSSTFSGVRFTPVADLASQNACLRKVHLNRRMSNKEYRISKCGPASLLRFDIPCSIF